MGWTSKLRLLLRGLSRRRSLENRMAQEFRFHIDEYVEELIRNGVPREVAERRARVEFGGVESVKDDCRRARGLTWIDEFRQDLTFGFRSLARNKGFSATAIVTLSLGIGATTAIFSVIYAVLIRPLPYPEPDQLVRVEVMTESPFGTGGVRSGPLLMNDFPEVRERAGSLVDLSLYGQVAHTLTGQGAPVRLSGAEVSPSLFPLLGARPALGRLFESDEERPGNDRIVVLSNRTWTERFGADPGIVGRAIRLDEDVHTVVGVMERTFGFPDPEIEFWKPANPEPVFSIGNVNFVFVAAGPAIARLADGVSVERAEAEVESIVRSLHSAEITPPEPGGAELPPGRPPGFSDPFAEAEINLVPIQEEMVRGVRPALLVLFGSVVFVLMIACVNVANLLLSRSTSRQVEVGVRVALGAGRLRLVRQVLTESLLLAAGGGILGVFIAAMVVRLLSVLGPEWLPRLEEIALNGPVLGFAVGATFLTGLLFGLAPAVRLSRTGASSAINEGRAQASSGTEVVGRHPLRGTLVAAQVALAVVLLVGGGLLIHSFRNLADTPLGYDPENVLSFVVELPPGRYSAPGARSDFMDGLLARMNQHPAVVSASATNGLPNSGIMLMRGMVLEGESTSVRDTAVTPGFFETLRIPVVEGRTFTDRDPPGSVVINEAFARQFFPDGAIGRRVPGPAGEQVVGVVGNITQPANVAESTENAIYSKLDTSNGSPAGFGVPVTFVVRTRDLAPTFISEARQIVSELDAQVAIDRVQTLEASLSASIAEPRFYAVALGIFAGVALSLAAVGIYGVMAYAVTQRTREIGIRMALGARRRAVMRLVLSQGLMMTVAGLAVGVAGSMAVTRYLEGMLFGLSPLDPTTFVVMTTVLVVVAVIACGIPARRAVRIDPSSALRHE